ncbi:MAG TPA: ACT domain-containing protein [Gammaproteobacteria bacterium]
MKRIMVVAADRKGLIADLSELLEQAGVNINSIDAVDEDGTAYISLEVDRYDETLVLLRDSEYQAVPEEVLVIRIEDRPGGLARIARRLSENDVGIRGMTMLQRTNGWCAVAVTTDDNGKSRTVLVDVLMES